MIRVVPLVALVACEARVSDGVAVGNPTMDATLARTDGVVVDRAVVSLGRIALAPCDGGPLAVVDGGSYDLARGASFALPAGLYCRMDLPFEGTLELRGQGASGGVLEGAIDLSALRFALADADAVGRRTAYVVEVGPPGWLDPVRANLDAGDEVHLEAAHPAYSDIRDALATRSALFVDANEDGAVSDEERAVGAIAGSMEYLPVDTGGDS